MTLRRVILILLCFSTLCAWVSRLGWFPASRTLDTDIVRQEQGRAFFFRFSPATHAFLSFPNDKEKHLGSWLEIYESGRKLGPAHAQHRTIREQGGGRFSHWGNQVYFSSSDNTDPRKNSREYRLSHALVVRAEIPWVLTLLLALVWAGPKRIRQWPAMARKEPFVVAVLVLPLVLTCFFSGASRAYHIPGMAGLLILVVFLAMGTRDFLARERPEGKKSRPGKEEEGHPLGPGESPVFFLALAGVLFLYRLVFVLLYPDVFIEDSRSYMETLVQWDRGGGLFIPMSRTPLYPLFVLFAGKFLGLGKLVLVQHMTLMLMVTGLAWMLRARAKTRAGRIGALVFLVLAGLNPSGFRYGSALMTEGLEPQFLMLVIMAYMAWLEKRKPFWIVLLAFLCVAAFWLRPVNAFLFLAVPLSLLFASKARIRALALFFLGILAFNLPWMVYSGSGKKRSASDLSILALTHSYGHLLSMDRPTFPPYKKALRPSYDAYMAHRKELAQQNRLLDLLETGEQCTLWSSLLIDRFHLFPDHAHKVLTRMVWEGVLDHPAQAAFLVAGRLAVFYIMAPFVLENADYRGFMEWWAHGKLKPEVHQDYIDVYKNYGLPPLEDAKRARRFEKARPLIAVNGFLGRVWGLVSGLGLLVSIILAPAIFKGKRRLLAIFVFFMVHVYCLVIGLLVPPDTRFFYPMVIPVYLLVVLEILSREPGPCMPGQPAR